MTGQRISGKQTNMAQCPELGDRPEWILRILYAPARGVTGKPIVGTTRLMKACFLVQRTLDSEFDISTDFEFHPNDYGPLDEKVYKAVEVLEEDNLIRTRESERYNGTEYSLTESGEREAKVLFKDLDQPVQDHLEWIKSRHVLKSLPQLLSFVYNQYPEMASESKLVY